MTSAGGVWVVMVVTLAGGCGEDDDKPSIDSSVVDARVADAASADGATDGALDGATSDAAPTDAAAPDAASADLLRINEVYMTTTGGDTRRFVELSGPAGASLAGLQLRLLRGNGMVTHTVDVSTLGAMMPADGHWVVGGALVSNVDQFYTNAQWGLDSTQGAVQLVRATTLLDVVGYGAAVTPAPATPPTATVEGATAVPVPAQDTDSIGRRAGAADSNVNSADFCRMIASPGNPNSACL